MKCLYCQADLRRGTISYTINRHGYHLVIDDLVAYTCSQCGEYLLDETSVDTIQKLITEVDGSVKELQKAVA